VNGIGIFAQNTSGTAGGGNIQITAVGSVAGNVAGVEADTSIGADSGSVNVHTESTVTATTGVGILAETNSGTVTVGGQIDFGVTPADSASFVNQVGGVFDMIDDSAGIVAYTSYDTAAFSNAGLLEKTGGTATSAIHAAVTNTGSIVVASGTIGFYGGGSLGGSISGAGTVAFAGGTSTLSATTTSAHFLVNGGTLAIAANETVSGPFSATSGTVTVAGGATLKLASTASFDTASAYGPTISGPGTLSTAGATTLATQTAAYVDLYLGAGATWTNSGTATIGGQIDFGVTVADHASFINQAGGVFDLIDDSEVRKKM